MQPTHFNLQVQIKSTLRMPEGVSMKATAYDTVSIHTKRTLDGASVYNKVKDIVRRIDGFDEATIMLRTRTEPSHIDGHTESESVRYAIFKTQGEHSTDDSSPRYIYRKSYRTDEGYIHWLDVAPTWAGAVMDMRGEVDRLTARGNEMLLAAIKHTV